MIDNYQTTIAKQVKFSGIGLHTGQNSNISVMPTEDQEGIVFKRVDLKENNIIEANYLNVSSAKLCTTLKNNFGVKVSTVEHLLGALYIAEIDNAIIEIDSEEIPIMDGSAKIFLEKFKKAGIKTLSKKRKFFKITSKVELVDGERKISAEPEGGNTLEVEFQLNYKNKIIGNQKNIINFKEDNLEDISKSRTFCLYQDIEKIKKEGLAKGGSLDNAIVIDDEKILNKEGLRNEKEFVNHKILDLAGDFFLSGYRILGKIKCNQGGHELTNKFLRKLFKNTFISSTEEKSNQIIVKENILNTAKKIAASA